MQIVDVDDPSSILGQSESEYLLTLSGGEADGAIHLKCSNSIDSLNNNINSNSMHHLENQNTRENLRQRKIVGLLKLIQEKNSQIESLKYELNKMKETSNTPNALISSSTSDLNTSFTNSSSSKLGSSYTRNNESNSLRILMDSLEKEIQIYQNLNSNNNKK